MEDDAFLDRLADRLAGLPGVEAVTLGGSRATGRAAEDADWDLGVYDDGTFDPDDLRSVGWSGQVFDRGAWGGGVFDGGAWLDVDGRHVDVHYRDLRVVEHELAEARAGRVRWEPLMFHLAGIPTYLLVAELAVNRVLRGSLPTPGFPDALREAAPAFWRGRAHLTLDHARGAHAARGHRAETVAAVAVAGLCAAHAVLAARGAWATNEKRMLDDAGLRGIDDLVADVSPGPEGLLALVDRAAAIVG